MEYYTHLAEDNKKLYKPNTGGYNDCHDANQKIIQSLKISDSEPLELSSEETDTKTSTRNAVDVALSLSEAFDQVPEDVDLTAFIQESSSVRQPSPKKQLTSKEQTAVRRELSPVDHPNITVQPCAQNTTSGNKSKKQPKIEYGNKTRAN